MTNSHEKISSKDHFTFPEAIDQIPKEDLENTLVIIDIDGVLLKIDLTIFFKGLFFYLFNKEKFNEFLEKNKIPLSYLLKIKRLVEKKVKIVLFTSRFLTKDKNFFPFIDQNSIERFKEVGIKIIAQNKALPGISEDLLDKIKNSQKIFYLGSGILDQKIFNKIKTEFKDKELEYFNIGEGRII